MEGPITTPVYEPEIGEREKEYVNRCLDTGWVSARGEFVDRFEQEFAAYVGCEHGVSVSNGTTALHLALLALGIGPGDEVIVPTLTYVASANAVAYTGATPVFVDSLPGTWAMDPDDVRRVITTRTRAIMPVHLYGCPCDMTALMGIAQQHGLLVVEDCAEAIGTKVNDRHVGTFGDLAIFSFYGNKTITTGEGGMVVTNSPNLAERCRHLKGQGLAHAREYWHDVVGYNYRMTNICAAIGCAQLERIEETLARKAAVAAEYRRLLADRYEFQAEPAGAVHSHWMVSLLVDRAGDRNALRANLRAAGVETRPLFYPVHTMPMYVRSYRRTPVADDLGSRGVNLPSFPGLSQTEIAKIGRVLRRETPMRAAA
ncbi:Putative pyridoxal phosphate-dependent aminotransferase EpsN [Pirellulimonas nuda]|uniref:GDP-perosamine synthase n=1 Tax=Pirellulimonas nuda TaxID=2528009 RepID=A0A518DGB3_9BACT|nr:aminotransferase class I/II-fold pyridoxal phosphate-dependent enzyme [Pirellulimonas nuda]QDU90517.1 Putative pyridoxal phosphate-dependent aminotransferase EpsN [Pirellulimonas nuda]